MIMAVILIKKTIEIINVNVDQKNVLVTLSLLMKGRSSRVFKEK